MNAVLLTLTLALTLPITCNQPLRNIVTLVYNVLKTFMGMNGKMFDELTNSYKSDRLRWVGVHPAVCVCGGGRKQMLGAISSPGLSMDFVHTRFNIPTD